MKNHELTDGKLRCNADPAGVVIGSCIPVGTRKKAMAIAGGVFAVTYVPLMKKVFGIAKEMIEEQK